MRRQTACASLASRAEQRENRICEDGVGKFTANGITSIILSDGAGSRKHSATGARTAVQSVGRAISKDFHIFVKLLQSGKSSQVANELLRTVQTELSSKRFATIDGIEEYASTLLFAASDKEKLLLGQLGDGGIVLSGLASKLAFEPIRGEFANQTCFTTSSTALSDFQLRLLPLNGVTGVTLFSDGVASSIIENATGAVAPAIQTMVGWLQEHKVKTVEKALLENLKNQFIQRTHDDCSINIMALS